MGKYRCANSVEEIKTYIGNSRVVAFDFETAPDEQHRGEDKAALDPAKAHIVGCSFSVRKGTCIYVPIKHLMGKNVDEEEFFAFLRDFLSDKNIIKVAHNLAFESAMAYTRLGVIIQAPVYDTICAAQLVNNGDVKFRSLKDSGLKQLTSEQFGEDLLRLKKLRKAHTLTNSMPMMRRQCVTARRTQILRCAYIIDLTSGLIPISLSTGILLRK